MISVLCLRVHETCNFRSLSVNWWNFIVMMFELNEKQNFLFIFAEIDDEKFVCFLNKKNHKKY